MEPEPLGLLYRLLYIGLDKKVVLALQVRSLARTPVFKATIP